MTFYTNVQICLGFLLRVTLNRLTNSQFVLIWFMKNLSYAAPLVEADKETDEGNFLLWRLEKGVAEGSAEIPKGIAPYAFRNHFCENVCLIMIFYLSTFSIDISSVPDQC